MLLNALLKLMTLMASGFWYLRHCSMILQMMKICSVQDLPVRNPVYSSLRHWSWVLHSCQSRTTQSTSPGTERRAIPHQVVQSELLPVFGILTVAPLHQASGTFPFHQHLLNNDVSSSVYITWLLCLGISPGISS